MTYLPFNARRILNKPQLISERGALAVLGALAPRLGIARALDSAGRVIDLGPPPAAAFDQEGMGDEKPAAGRRLFDLDEATGIAVIEISGELVHKFAFLQPTSGMTGYNAIKIKLDAAIDDPAVKGILLDFDSPGGEVFGANDTAEAIFLAREAKPIWALINEQAASSAYWLASAAHLVFAPETADCGSIGVVMVHVDMSEKLRQEGLSVTLIHAGKHKVDGDPFRPLPPGIEAEFQAEVETVRTLFATKVARNRKMSVDAVLATEARIYMGASGVLAGLVDAVGSEDEIFELFATRLALADSMALPTG